MQERLQSGGDGTTVRLARRIVNAPADSYALLSKQCVENPLVAFVERPSLRVSRAHTNPSSVMGVRVGGIPR